MGKPATSMLSFDTTGIPCNGPTGRPLALRAASSWSASSSPPDWNVGSRAYSTGAGRAQLLVFNRNNDCSAHFLVQGTIPRLAPGGIPVTAPSTTDRRNSMSAYLALLRRVARSITRRVIRADRVYSVGRHRLKLPWDCCLDVYQANYKRYDWALGEIAREIFAKYPKSCAIDIGANVGDSAALICKHQDVPVLCI